MEKIDNLDKKILGILSQNARIPFKDVAAECGVSRAAIHQRVQHLIEGGIITGSGFDVNPKSLGNMECPLMETSYAQILTSGAFRIDADAVSTLDQ